MPFIVGLLQNKLAHLATRFTTKCIAFCQPIPKQSSITQPSTTSTSTTLISLNKPNPSYISPYQRSIYLLEQLLSLPAIARFLYPLLLEEHNNLSALHYKDPQIPLKTLFSHGYTLNIVLNELQSLLIPTIDVHEGVGEIGYECHQTQLFWTACQNQDLITNPDMIPDQLSPDTYQELNTNQPYFEAMTSTISRILDIHRAAGRLSLHNLQYFTILPQMIYPLPSTSPPPAAAAPGYMPSLETLTSELSSTEVTYLADLQQLSDYARTVRGILGYDNKATSHSLFRSSVSLTSGPKQEMLDINQIFYHIDDLLSLHTEFSLRVQYLSVMPANHQYFAAAYQGLLRRWDVYARYAAQYDKSQRVYQAALPVLKQLSGYSLLDPEIDVPALLLRPIQRLAQYPLIFQSILDAARRRRLQEPPVIKSMKEALKCSKQILKRTNEAARESLNALEETRFQDTVDPESLRHHRLSVDLLGHLHLFGSQLYVRLDQSNNSECAEVYLFENYLILAHQQISKMHKTFSIQSLTNRRQSNPPGSKRFSQMSLSTKCGSPKLPPLDIPSLDTPLNMTPIREKTLNSYASLNSLRETVNMELDSHVQLPQDDPASHLFIKECFAISCIYQVDQQDDGLAPGYYKLVLRIHDSGDVERVVELRQLTLETVCIWICKLKRTRPSLIVTPTTL